MYLDVFNLEAVCKQGSGEIRFPLKPMPPWEKLCWKMPGGEVVPTDLDIKYFNTVMKKPAARANLAKREKMQENKEEEHESEESEAGEGEEEEDDAGDNAEEEGEESEEGKGCEEKEEEVKNQRGPAKMRAVKKDQPQRWRCKMETSKLVPSTLSMPRQESAFEPTCWLHPWEKR